MRARPRYVVALNFALALLLVYMVALPAWAQNTVRYLSVWLGTASTAAGSLVFYNASNSNTATYQSGVTTTTYTCLMPQTKGTSGQYLKTDGGTPCQLSFDTVVTTSTILDSTVHTDTLTGTVVRGDVMVGNLTPKWARLAKGAANTFLGSDGTDVSYVALTLAGAQFANQGTTTTVLHGNALGNPSFGAVSLTADVSGNLPLANGGFGTSLSDPNADRIPFWDDSAGLIAWLAPGNSLAITDTTLDTIQDIRTTAAPQFARLGIGAAADASVKAIVDNGPDAVSPLCVKDNGTNVLCVVDGGYLRAVDGALGNPGYSFLNDTDSGMFYASDSGNIRVRLVSNGNSYLGLDNSGAMVGGRLSFIDTNLNSVSITRNVSLSRHSATVIRASSDGAGGNITHLIGGGAAVASAAALPVPTGNVFHVTGTTNVTSITSTNFATGTVITLIFDGVLTFTDGSNLVLAGDFVTTANDTITLVYDGTNWHEITRAVN